MTYGSSFLQGTKSGRTYAAGWRIDSSGVVDNGTIVNAGNTASDGPITSVIEVNELADDVGGATGSKVIASVAGGVTTDRVGVSGAVAGNVVDEVTSMGFNANATQWIMKGGNVSTTIGGVANTVLAGGGSDYNGAFATRSNLNHSILAGSGAFANAAHTYDATARPSTNITPNFTREAGGGTYTLNNTDGTVALTGEIIPSKSVPGELTYRFGGPNPKQDDYKNKAVRES